MQRRSQGNNELAEFHPDITALERSNRRGANRGSAQSMEGNRMEHGEGSGEGNAAFTQSVPVAGGNVEPRMHNSPVRRHTQTQDRRDDENGDNVRIGTFDEPWARPARTGIVVPRIPANNFEMKQGLMNAVRNLQFHGRPSDNPLDHLDTFDRICSIYKVGNVPLNTIRMMMFPFSLADGATVWEREIPSDLVSNWEDVKKEFLKAFFPKQKTAKIREEIVSFKQRSHESFAQAWDRMKRYIRACPHHGFSRDSILGIFYRGCDASNRMYLDSASGGCFADNTVKNGESIIANLARSSGQGFDEDDDYDRDDGSAGADSKGLKEMHRKLDLVLKGQINRKEVSFVREAERAEERADAEFDYDEEINYVDNNQGFQNRGYSGQGFNSNGGQPFRSNYGGQGGMQPQRFNNFNQGVQRTYPSNNNFNPAQSRPYNGNGGSYQRPPFQSNQSNDAGPPQNRNFNYSNQERLEKLEALITKSMEESNKVAIEQGRRIEALGESLNRRMDGWDEKLDKMAARVTTLEKKIADVATSIKPYGNGILPGKPEQNPKNFCQFLGGDKDSAWDQEPESEHLTFSVDEDHYDEQIYATDESWAERAIFTTPPPHCPSTPSHPRTIDRPQMQARAYADVVRALNIMTPTEELQQMLMHDSAFSSNFYQIQEHKEWYEERFHTLPIQTSGHHDTRGDLEQVRYVTEKLRESDRCDEMERRNTEVLEEGDRSNPEDPKCFILPCFVNGTAFRKCVLDLGASKSVMPLDIASAIGITGFEKSETSLILADWTARKTTGLARNIPITFEGHTVHTDFLILDTNKSGPGRIILGRPFLEECSANFDVRHGIVSFTFKDNCRCCIYRDWDIDEYGGRTNVSVMRFFQQLALETRKRASCLGGTTGFGQKHRIVELVEEYESSKMYTPYRPKALKSRSLAAGSALKDTHQTAQQGENSNRGRGLNKVRDTRTPNTPIEVGVIAKGPRGGKSPLRGTEIFEWRVKTRKKRTRKKGNDATGDKSDSTMEKEVPQPTEQPPKVVTTAAIPAGDEIEPGDIGNQTREDPQLS